MFDRRAVRSRDAFRGCLLGGAVGDALGAPVEFMKLAEIRQRFGRSGVTELVPAYGRLGAITDDTQMTIFTAEALIRAQHRLESRGICSLEAVTWNAYQRWLGTQGQRATASRDPGWLAGAPELHARRAPGNTCLSALGANHMGTVDEPVNDSKGCGGVMRVAPLGLVANEPFRRGRDNAALTHGHASGQLAAGYLAQLIADVLAGATLRDAAHAGLRRLGEESGHEETSAAVESALRLADDRDPSPEAVESLGAGWVAEEALAIGLYCALSARDFEHGVLLAVNHGGDSDSTGSIAGNLMGLLAGERGIPRRWLEQLELREVIAQLADDLWDHFGLGERTECTDFDRYPPS
jgi:ADP-ribosylglycohydrolase